VQDSPAPAFSISEAAVVIFIPRFAAVALGILLRPAESSPAAMDPAGPPPAVAGFDAIDAVFVGTVLDVWHLGDQQVARFVVERPARGSRIGEIIGVVSRPECGFGAGISAGERWMILTDRWPEAA
jgi:hypothetical protein